MTLREYAMRLGIGYTVARERWRAGKINGAYKAKNGRIIVPENNVTMKGPNIKLAAYAEGIGISYTIAWKMYKRGEIPGAFRLSGKMILVPVATLESVKVTKKLMSIDFGSMGIECHVGKNPEWAMYNLVEATGAVIGEVYSRDAAKLVVANIFSVTGWNLKKHEEVSKECGADWNDKWRVSGMSK